MIYCFARFKLVRENEKGLKTFMHPLPDLTEEEERLIVEASRTNKAARSKRARMAAAAITHDVLLTIKRHSHSQAA
jgi:hypothetical protein